MEGRSEVRSRVLLVSPPGAELELYVSSLHAAGFATTLAESTRAARDWLADAASADVLVIDLLPDPDQAWAVIGESRALPRRVPVIVLTSLVRPDGANRRMARALDCAAFVAKPCSPRQLVNVVSRVHHGEYGLEILDYTD